MLKRIPLDLIDPDPNQPRKIFDEEALEELARSIDQNGLKQPITVRPADQGRYQIVMGERRWRAYKILQDEGEPMDIGTILVPLTSEISAESLRRMSFFVTFSHPR